MADLSVKFTVQIPGGPTIQSDRKLAVSTHQKVDLSLPPNKAGTAKIDVDFTPDDTDKINLLLIQSSLYSDNLTFTIDETDIKDQKLVEPVLLLGSELIKAIAMPNKITFANKANLEDPAKLAQQTAQITVLVGRAASPPPEPETPAEEPADPVAEPEPVAP
ncbi:hypothetical protein C8255_15650 [filamentous cyanobacterium CCP3]|nr:hypothetical protein C8255_15650 [filamentous cyanobacterium CCP3]